MTKDNEKYQAYVQILNEELIPAIACTEPLALDYAAAKAREVLGCLPDRVCIGASGSIIKNVKSVIVPNTNHLKGIPAAAAAGIVAGNAEKELIFYDSRHRSDFSSLLLGRRKKNLCGLPNYAAAVFLLSADENLWEKVSKQVLDTGIYFDRIRLGSVTLEQYILFHAARDVYLGTKHIRLSELTDRELIPDEILRLIVNAFVMERYGVDIVEREVWNED